MPKVKGKMLGYFVFGTIMLGYFII